jgi:hypothetical protein
MLNNRKKLKKGNEKKRSLCSVSTSAESYDPEKEKTEKRLQLIESKLILNLKIVNR